MLKPAFASKTQFGLKSSIHLFLRSALLVSAYACGKTGILVVKDLNASGSNESKLADATKKSSSGGTIKDGHIPDASQMNGNASAPDGLPGKPDGLNPMTIAMADARLAASDDAIFASVFSGSSATTSIDTVNKQLIVANPLVPGLPTLDLNARKGLIYTIFGSTRNPVQAAMSSLK